MLSYLEVLDILDKFVSLLVFFLSGRFHNGLETTSLETPNNDVAFWGDGGGTAEKWVNNRKIFIIVLKKKYTVRFLKLPAVVKDGKFSEKSSRTQIAHVLSFLLSDSLNCEFYLLRFLRVSLFCSKFQSLIYLRNIDLSFLQDEHLGTVLSLSYNLHFCFVGFLFHGVNDLNYVFNFYFVRQILIQNALFYLVKLDTRKSSHKSVGHQSWFDDFSLRIRLFDDR